MISNQQRREELRQIQEELRKLFPAEDHGIRELPGKGYWAFLAWHKYRERLDDVYPEWECSFTAIEQIASDVSCRCTITILGISKQAIGSVPLVAAEKNGRDVSRGNAADRVAAESFKNACEAWGIGRYLDRQSEVVLYLNANATKLDHETRAKLRPFANYLREKGLLPEINSTVSSPRPESTSANSQKVISAAQVKRLWAIAKPLPQTITRGIIKNIVGVESTEEIPWTKYNEVIQSIEAEINKRTSPHPHSIPESLSQSQSGELIPQAEIDRKLLAEEINSLRKRKNLDSESVKNIMVQVTGKEDGTQCTNSELLKVRDKLALQPAIVVANQ